jgi:ABC-type phosphate transport system permease subunit
MANETSDSARAPLGLFLTVMTVLFVVLALSDFTKALQFLNNPALSLVVFGHKFHGVANNLVLGPLFGVVLLIYAHGIWHLRAWVLPLAIVYAFYVPYNLVLFWYTQPAGPRSIPFIVGYLAIALIGSIGTAIYLAYHRERLS